MCTSCAQGPDWGKAQSGTTVMCLGHREQPGRRESSKRCRRDSWILALLCHRYVLTSEPKPLTLPDQHPGGDTGKSLTLSLAPLNLHISVDPNIHYHHHSHPASLHMPLQQPDVSNLSPVKAAQLSLITLRHNALRFSSMVFQSS